MGSDEVNSVLQNCKLASAVLWGGLAAAKGKGIAGIGIATQQTPLHPSRPSSDVTSPESLPGLFLQILSPQEEASLLFPLQPCSSL